MWDARSVALISPRGANCGDREPCRCCVSSCARIRTHQRGVAMAPASAVVVHHSPLQQQSKKPLEKVGSGRTARLGLDSWGCTQPSARPQFSFSASSCAGQKNTFRCKTTLTMDMSFSEGDDASCARESGCETPRSKKHRIPVVDVDRCPPAPKKARAHSRLSVVCEGSNLLQKLGLSTGYLF